MTRNRGPIDSAATGSVAARPDLLAHPSSALTRLVRLNIKLVRRTLLSKRINRLLVWCQQHLGPAWVDYCTRNIRRVHGLDRLPPRESIDNFILIANHRSYFDLFVASMVLFRDKRIRSRIVFTVRSSFFYDRPLGFLVNGVMSFWSMYPPVFREQGSSGINLTAMDELADLVSREGFSTGIHPEGTRNKTGDPYALLPARIGVGRVIHQTRTPVIPVFINGLGNHLPRQIVGSFTGRGETIVIVFGKPVEFCALLDQPAGPDTYRAIADRAMSAIYELGEEERIERLSLAAPGVRAV